MTNDQCTSVDSVGATNIKALNTRNVTLKYICINNCSTAGEVSGVQLSSKYSTFYLL